MQRFLCALQPFALPCSRDAVDEIAGLQAAESKARVRVRFTVHKSSGLGLGVDSFGFGLQVLEVGGV